MKIDGIKAESVRTVSYTHLDVYKRQVVGQNNGLIENVAVSGIVSGTSKYTGGIVGINAGIIKNAEVDITVNNTSGGYSGGITGYNYKGLGEIDGIVGKIKVINSTGGYTCLLYTSLR